jgi:hypothetical protein
LTSSGNELSRFYCTNSNLTIRIWIKHVRVTSWSY